MAKSTTTANAWDLSDGMDVDYSGNKEIAAADKSFADAQKIIDNAYKLDTYAETQQSTIDKTNAANQAYLDTVGTSTALTNAKNVDLLNDYGAKTELEQAMQAADGYANDSTPEQVIPEKRELTGYVEQNIEGRNVQVPQYKVTPEQRIAGTSTQRPRTQLERLQAALPQLSSPRARAVAQDAIRKEITNQAYQLHAFEPDKALKLLRESGLGVTQNLQRGEDGNFNIVRADGTTMKLSPFDASAMVGDIIKGTNDLRKNMEARQREAAAMAKQEAKDAAMEDRADARNERALEVARLSAQAKVGAGRYGRNAQFDEDGNLVIGGGLGGGGASKGQAQGGSFAALIAGTGSAKPSTQIPATDFNNKTYAEVLAAQQAVNDRLRNLQKTPDSDAYRTAKAMSDLLAPVVAKKAKDSEQDGKRKTDPKNFGKPTDAYPIRQAGTSDREWKIILNEWSSRKAAYNDSIMADAATNQRGQNGIGKSLKQQREERQ